MNKKIVIIAGTLAQGGAERQLIYIIDALKRIGYIVHVISLTSNEYYEKKIIETGIPVWHIKQRNSFLRLAEICMLCFRIKPDIIYSHHFFCNLYAAISGKFLRIKSIGAFRSNYTREVNNNGKFLGRLCAKLPDAILANSYEAIKNAKNDNINTKRIYYLSNVVDIQKFSPSKNFTKDENIIRIISVGRYIPLKRYELMFKIVNEVSKCRNLITFELNIYGDGSMKDALNVSAKFYSTENCKIFVNGIVDNIEDEYRKNDVFILTSEKEGTPNVVIEALACGLYVIASSVGNLPYIFSENELIKMIDKDDFKSFTNALEEYINFEFDEETSVNLRKYILRNFSEQALQSRLKECLDEIIRK